tara:strand:- start:1721 stop:2362 length:642 start_codon:yes stop_codon:yes gene_type:complete
MKKIFNKSLEKLFNRKSGHSHKQDKEKLDKKLKIFWNKVETGIDKEAEEFIWNKQITKENFKSTDFTDQVNKRIEEHLDKIKHNNIIVSETDQQNIKLNIIFLTIYSYATNMSIVDGIILYLGLLILSLYICYLWHNKVKNCWMLNTVNMAIIRRLQEHLPLKTHGDAEFKMIQYYTGGHHHPSFLTSMMLAKIFGTLYCLTFTFYLIDYFSK